MNRVSLRLAWAACLLVSACRTTKPVSTPPQASTTPPQTLTVPRENRLQVRYLVAKADLNYQDPEQSFDGKLQIRLAQDSLLWIRITGLMSIEGMRLLANPDSVVVIDKLNEEIITARYDNLSRLLGFPLDWPGLQALVLGNLPFEASQAQASDTSAQGSYRLNLRQGPLDCEARIDLATQRHKLLTLLDSREARQLKLTLAQRDSTRGFFPLFRKIELSQSKQTSQASLTFTQVEFPASPPEFPFPWPKGYTRRRF